MYHSTRNKKNKVCASYSILNGLADDGGLYVPEEIPKVCIKELFLNCFDYKKLAKKILSLYLDDFSEESIDKCVENAYSDKFDSPEVCPVKKIGEKYYLELFHGPTIAFKDLALSILPELISAASDNLGLKEEILILTATSGDTGKAALEGFKDREKIKIAVFYPKNGVSNIQEKQMRTQDGNNLYVFGINGNFDEAQKAVKKTFSKLDFNKKMKANGYVLSSANSINIGRLIPQIVYYFYAYFKIVKNGEIKLGEKINISVPTGNFGNILASYYALRMGLPINKLICASNKNKVLTDFLANGVYNKNRRFYTTSSPSMDILVSGNLERMLYHASDEDTELVKKYMDSLAKTGKYEVHLKILAHMDNFAGEYANEAQTRLAINDLYKKTAYVIDPHTAVAEYAYTKYKEKTKDNTVTLIVSTASPFKFPEEVLKALKKTDTLNEDNTAEMLERLSETAKVDIPKSLLEIYKKPERFNEVIETDDIEKKLLKLEMLNVKNQNTRNNG